MSAAPNKRLRLTENLYFKVPSVNLEFIHSGAAVLDCVLGGGWPLGRIVNVVGDKSTGKTLLAIEALTNFLHQYPDGEAYYAESEAAFNQEYAQALGLPLDNVNFPEGIDTVEQLFDSITDALKKADGRRTLYILDSLDALTDEGEKSRDIRDGTYGTGKSKQMSQLLRRLVRDVERSKACVMIISQVRDNIGATFGRKYTRSGGRALDFYASIVIYLAHLEEKRRTVGGVKRTVGVDIKAKCTKNKVGLPFRECKFPVIFAYGIEDISANLDWLEENGKLGEVGLSAKEIQNLKGQAISGGMAPADFTELRSSLAETVKKAWTEIETSFMPKKGKYA